MQRIRLGTLDFFLGDLVAGVSAAFVLIPQALAYASLAGLPPERGLFVAALAPTAAAFLASSPYLATGPTAVTSLLTLGALTALASEGSDEYVALATLLALLVGAARVVMGLLHGGMVAYLMSQPVVLGFTTGAGVAIFVSQIPTVLGVEPTSANPFSAAVGSLTHPGSWEPSAVIVAVGTAAVIIGGRRVHRLFPGILVAVALAIVFSVALSYGGPVVGRIESGLPPPTLSFPWSSAPQLLVPALVIALVGFSEPASIARRYATLERQRWDPNRELISQGVGNLAAALGGGFPAGGSFSRSALVRDAGARTKWAGGITGLVVLVLLPMTPALSPLPMAFLGATIMVGVRDLISVEPFLDFRRYAPLQFMVAAATFLLTIVLAPRVEWAVIVGVVFAVGAHLWREVRLAIPAWTSDRTLHLAPKGVLYFASAPSLEGAFSKLLGEHPDATSVVVHLDGLGRIDLTGALALRALLEDARQAGLEPTLDGIPPPAAKIIARVIEGRSDI
ncbi:MAG: SulP family inorganic anion transporter [Actinomycetota bacterium]|nr:SulP family inorganic anion transporter [Actinomycetota bacterium]